MSKQTAVEWLWRWINDNQEATIEQGNKAFEQALAMEKKQIMDAIYDNMGTNFDPNMGRAEQYYNETYNK